jgi:hypothetical protein
MTLYLMAVHHSPDAPPPPPEQMQKAFEQVDVFNAEVKAAGAWVFGGGLHPPDIATVVRVADGETITTDGPFAETKEGLGGFYLIEAPDLDAALALAEQCPGIRFGSIEVRPVVDYSQAGASMSVGAASAN